MVEDTVSARRGGDLGYRPRGRNPAAYDEVAFEMEVDAVSDVVETPLGYHVIQLLGKREGDVPEDEAKLELARDLYLDDVSLGMARDAASAALEALQGPLVIDDLDRWLSRSEAGEDPNAAPAEPVEGEAPVEEEVVERPADAPQVTESSSFSRTGRPIAGVDSSELVRDVFTRDLENPLPDAPVELGRSFVIYQLTERDEATREEFEDGVSDRIRDGLLRAKQRETVALFVRNLRAEAENAGRVRIELFELEIESVQGDGVVTSNPAGLRCGDDCRASFEFGNMVQLIAEPAPGGRFLGWSGACSGLDTTCTVTMDQAQSVSARFRDGVSGGENEDEAEEE